MEFLLSLKRHFHLLGGPPRFDKLYKEIIGKKLKILDVGCGNHSCQLTKKIFPTSKYYGIDLTTDYNNSEEDFQKMEKFWLINLDDSNLNEVPNNFFDIIILSHVIEHLKSGMNIILKLKQKLKPKGILYIEFPSYHTLKLPSLKKFGVTFNFYDDETHIKIIHKADVVRSLENNNFIIKKAKVYFSWKKIAFLPFLLLFHFLKERSKCAYELFWLVGWCTYIIAIK